MIDIHSHILPAVDDGSANVDQSIAMLGTAARQGITHIVLTPHYRADYLTKRSNIEAKFNELKAAADERGINVKLYLGQEIFVFRDILAALDSGKLLTMNNSKYVLVEFSTKQIMDITETVYMLKSGGYIPIVAHIGRYFYSDIATAREVKEIGGLIQVNAGSVCRSLLHRRKVFELIREGLVDFVASDVHFKRTNCMAEAYKTVKKKFGEETANKLFIENAKKIICE